MIRLCDIAERGSDTYCSLRSFATGKPLKVNRVHVQLLQFKRYVERFREKRMQERMQDMMDARNIAVQLLNDHAI